MPNPERVLRTFDRLVSFDERSRQYPIRAAVPKAPRSYTWRPGPVLDQGREGACVGFGWTHEFMARPLVVDAALGDKYKFAYDLYREAQKVDEWEGEDYDGTSVLAGAKVARDRGWCKEYRWAFGLQDMILGVGYGGPCVIGVDWLEGMLDTDAKGYIHASGPVYGGHCVCVFSVNLRHRRFALVNSWGYSWGVNGWAYISFDDMGHLLGRQGEVVFPLKRALGKSGGERT